MREFIVGTKIFSVQKFVLRQWELLLKILVAVDLKNVRSVQDIMLALSCHLSRLMAISLVEKGTVFDKTKMEALEEFFGVNLDLDTSFDIVNDFLAITPIEQLKNKIAGIINQSQSTKSSVTDSKP